MALGVPEQVILEDYLLSNEYLVPKYAPILAEHPSLSPLFCLDASYLEAGLDQIRTDYGTVENYLTQELAVDISLLRELFLYPVN
ncbi:MAG: tyrosine-protein phosphatase [Rikenellaceae bacterium]|nr:tyrosine-protein phosphatase [Rikenellaceae bacterium]